MQKNLGQRILRNKQQIHKLSTIKVAQTHLKTGDKIESR